MRCCGPGCASSRCDRDHLDPWPAGPTSARNLGLASPRCHSAKHHGWTLVRHPDGSVTWTSPVPDADEATGGVDDEIPGPLLDRRLQPPEPPAAPVPPAQVDLDEPPPF